MDAPDPLVLHDYLCRLKARQLAGLRETDELAAAAWQSTNDAYLMRRAQIAAGREEAHRDSLALARAALPTPPADAAPPPAAPPPLAPLPRGRLARMFARLARVFLAVSRALGDE